MTTTISPSTPTTLFAIHRQPPTPPPPPPPARIHHHRHLLGRWNRIPNHWSDRQEPALAPLSRRPSRRPKARSRSPLRPTANTVNSTPMLVLPSLFLLLLPLLPVAAQTTFEDSSITVTFPYQPYVSYQPCVDPTGPTDWPQYSTDCPSNSSIPQTIHTYANAPMNVEVSFKDRSMLSFSLVFIKYINETTNFVAYALVTNFVPRTFNGTTRNFAIKIPDVGPQRFNEIKARYVLPERVYDKRLFFITIDDVLNDTWPNQPAPSPTGSIDPTPSNVPSGSRVSPAVLGTIISIGVVILIIASVTLFFWPGALRRRQTPLTRSPNAKHTNTMTAEMQAARDVQDAAAKARAKRLASSRPGGGGSAPVGLAVLTMDLGGTDSRSSSNAMPRAVVADSTSGVSTPVPDGRRSAVPSVDGTTDSPRSERRFRVSFSPAVVGGEDDDDDGGSRPSSRHSLNNSRLGSAERDPLVVDRTRSILYEQHHAAATVAAASAVGRGELSPRSPSQNSYRPAAAVASGVGGKPAPWWGAGSSQRSGDGSSAPSSVVGLPPPVPPVPPIPSALSGARPGSRTSSAATGSRRSSQGTGGGGGSVFRDLDEDASGGSADEDAIVVVVTPAAAGAVLGAVPRDGQARVAGGGGGGDGSAAVSSPPPPKGLFVEDEELVEDEADDGGWRRGSDDER
ncbi:hypothetical protein DFJ73DRAFT_296479 [Zopfochytrium polystomum]|nr:hypothetical protein DFJ73DRAFT_296479 [Zopfochytrium polystomum]